MINTYSTYVTADKASEPPQVILLAGGLAGVGKTTVAINLASALANRGHRVMVLDDYGDQAESSQPFKALKFGLFDKPQQAPQIVIIDTPAGGAEHTQGYEQVACEVLVVLGPEHSDVPAASRLIRALHERADVSRFRILVNRGLNETSAHSLFAELSRQVDQDICVALHYLGRVPQDDAMASSLSCGEAVVNRAPQSVAARVYKNLARRSETWAPPVYDDGETHLFIDRRICSEHIPNNAPKNSQYQQIIQEA